MNDAQIAAALRASSPDALAELFAAYGDRLFWYCWSVLRNREIAQVALRDTLVVAQAHIAALADPESLGPWLYSLARTECRRRRPVPADEAPVRPSQRDADSRLMAWNAAMSMPADEYEALELAGRHEVDLALVLGRPRRLRPSWPGPGRAWSMPSAPRSWSAGATPAPTAPQCGRPGPPWRLARRAPPRLSGPLVRAARARSSPRSGPAPDRPTPPSPGSRLRRRPGRRMVAGGR